MPKDSGRARAVLLLDGLGCALAAGAAAGVAGLQQRRMARGVESSGD